LQRQVLQHLVKQQAHPAMVTAVASNLGDMLWEQEKFAEAESVLDQARKVTFVLLEPHHYRDAASVCLSKPQADACVDRHVHHAVAAL